MRIFSNRESERVVGQFHSCSGGLRPPVLNPQGVPALGERRYSKLTHYLGANRSRKKLKRESLKRLCTRAVF